MSITAASPAAIQSTQIQLNQPIQQAQAARVERENDGDKDDGSKANKVAPAASPTVNTSGQSVGNVINVQA